MKLATPLSALLIFTLGSLAVGCTQNRQLGDKADAGQNGGGPGTGGPGTGAAGPGSGGLSGTGGRGSGGGGVPGTGGATTGTGGSGRGGTGGTASGGASASGGSMGTGGRGSGGSGGAGGSSGTGGRGSGGSASGGAGGGSSDGGAGCTDASFWCASGTMTTEGGLSCGDALTQPTCNGGAWVCPSGWFPTSQCDCLGVPPPGCTTCAATGFVCTDGGTDARTDGGVCDFGCYPAGQSAFCSAGQVTWECWGSSPNVSVLVNGGCTDAATGAIRYCCASTFLSQCPPRM